jgi:hypothetical protein
METHRTFHDGYDLEPPTNPEIEDTGGEYPTSGTQKRSLRQCHQPWSLTPFWHNPVFVTHPRTPVLPIL